MTPILHYIDPGTGSMLFTILIGVISAGVYALRKLAIKLRFMLSGGRQKRDAEPEAPLVMFSDDKRYWSVFEPICDELESRGIAASYLTASPDDPALSKNYAFVKREFIGEGNRAFAELNMLQADIVLSSTPGLEVYQWKRSRDVGWYVHVLHAVSDATMYRMFGIDYYDAVLLTGPFQERQVRELERLRNLPEKELRVTGLTYMDAMARRIEELGPAPEHPTTVLLAPSWGASAIFSLYGGTIIDALLSTGYHVIVRPHPQSFASEKDLIEGIMRDFPESEQLEWNRDSDNFEVLRRSDIMISDFSGVIFDFALVFDRPVIYTEPSYDAAPYDACWLDEEPWTFKVLPQIGRELEMHDAGSLQEIIEECLTDERFQAGRDQAREECWACRGRAAAEVVDYLSEKLATMKEKGPDRSTS